MAPFSKKFSEHLYQGGEGGGKVPPISVRRGEAVAAPWRHLQPKKNRLPNR
jgi:hypothetical protein